MKIKLFSLFLIISTFVSSWGQTYKDIPCGFDKEIYFVGLLELKDYVIVYTTKNHIFILPENVYNQYDGNYNFFIDNPFSYIVQKARPFKYTTPEVAKLLGGDPVYSHKDKSIPIKRFVESVKRYSREPDYFGLFIMKQYIYNEVYKAYSIDGRSSYPIVHENAGLYLKVLIPVFKSKQ